MCSVCLPFSVAETSLEPMNADSRASALYSFPVWEFLVGSGVSLWAVLAPSVACLACGLFPSFHIPSWSCPRLSPLSSLSHYAESYPPVHFLLPSFHCLWDLASDSAPSFPTGPRPGSRTPVNTWLGLRAAKGQGMKCPNPGWWPPGSHLRFGKQLGARQLSALDWKFCVCHVEPPELQFPHL